MNGKPLLEFNGDDKLERERLYAASLDQLLAVEDFDFDGSGNPEPSETIWTLTDYQGSVNSLYVSASRFTRLHYDDFGRPVEPRGTVEYNELRNTVSVGYLGLEFDDATSLYLDGTRPYDATAGRYFTAASFVNGIFGVYAFANNTPADRTVGALSNDFSGAGIDNGSNWVRLAGVLQAGFGIVEMVGGIIASVGTGGVGAVFGGLAVTANGADNIYAGLGSIWTGQSMETTLHRTVKSSATSVMSSENAERLATGVDIAAGFGAGWADDVVRAGAKYVEAGNSIAVAGQLAARHGAKFAKVQAGGIAAGTAIGATIGGAQNGWQGALDGALLGANVGSMAGGLAANFAVACFTAGTPLVVDREGNSRPIDEIEVGDFVLARSEFDPAGPLELKRVEEKFVRTAVVMELVVHGQSIKTTAEHPFYVPAQGMFVAAGELQVGEHLVGHDGKLVQIESIGSTGEVTTVYNLRVADFHTYFVGGGLWGFDVWVHNASYKQRIDQTPTNGTWSGRRGESTFTSASTEIIGVKVNYQNGYANLTPFAKHTVAIDDLVSVVKSTKNPRGKLHRMADKVLSERLGVDQTLIERFRRQNKFTWHEVEDMRTLQLVPAPINSKFGHVGGISIARGS